MRKDIFKEIQRRRELVNCVTDVNYFAEHYTTMQHPQHGAVRFTPYESQKTILHSYQENRWNITFGARQTGISLTNAIYVHWYAMFNPSKTIIISGNKQIAAKDVLDKIRFSQVHLPNWLQDENKLVVNNKHEMRFENDTRILAISSSPDAIRGYTTDLVLLDDFAHLSPRKQEDFYTSLYPAVMGSENSEIIMSSTAGGCEGIFTSIWDDAILKKNNFTPNFIRWDDIPCRDANFKDSMINMVGKERWNVEYECSFND